MACAPVQAGAPIFTLSAAWVSEAVARKPARAVPHQFQFHFVLLHWFALVLRALSVSARYILCC